MTEPPASNATADHAASSADVAPACVVAIVTFQSARYLPRLLENLAEASRHANLHVLVVDNDSTDDSVAIARAAGVEVVETGANLGYAGGLNVAFAHVPAASPVLILNPDLSLDPGAVPKLLAALRDPSVGVAVPLIREADGSVSLSLRREPSLVRSLADLMGKAAAVLPDGMSEMVWRRQAYAEPCTPEWACGAALLVSADCLRRIGPWDDERFFLYSEETDFFRRVREAGLRTVFVPEAEVCHIGGGSSSAPALVALSAISRVRYFEKYHGPWSASAYRLILIAHSLMRIHNPGHRRALHTLLSRARWQPLIDDLRSRGRRARGSFRKASA